MNMLFDSPLLSYGLLANPFTARKPSVKKAVCAHCLMNGIQVLRSDRVSMLLKIFF